jgi:integrase
MFLSKHHNGIYYLWFVNERGKKQKVSTRCTYKVDAVKFLQGFKRDEYEQRRKNKRKGLSEFLVEFLSYAQGTFSKRTVAIYKATVRNFALIGGDLPLTAYTPQHLDSFKTERQKTVKPVTVNIELRTLRAFFNTAVRWKLLDRTPFDVQLLRIPEAQPTFLTKLDFQRLLNTIKEGWLKEVILFAVSTGLRRGELVNLRWENVDLQKKLIVIESSPTFRTKSGRRRIIPLNENSFFLLQRKQSKDASEFVFTLNGRKLHADWITHLFKRYVRTAKLGNQNIHFHSLRHSFASWLAQDGTSLYVIKDLLGHSDVKTTQVYSHLQPEHLHSEVNKITVSLN